MENPDFAEEWAIQEYSSEEESGKLSWIANKGLSVGKKVLVTAFVISSVPLVLPSLMVISVIGFACSVPSGLFLASYVCTDKLMSKLLPGSTPPRFFLDCGTQYSDKEVENNGDEVGVKGFIDMGKEEEEVSEKNAYQEYVGHYEDEKEEEAEGIEVKIESVREQVTDDQLPVDDEVHAAAVVDIAGDEISGRTIEEGAPTFAVRSVVIELSQNSDTKEDQEFVRETRGLLEIIREEGMTDNGDEENQSLEKMSGVTEEGDRKVEEIGTPSDHDNVRIEKPMRESEHKIENKPKGSSTGSINVVPVERKPIEPIEGLLGKRDGDNILEAEKSKGGTKNASSTSKKPKIEKPYVLEEGRENENITKNVQDYQSNKEKEIVISTNADAREITDGSGIDVYDNANAALQRYSNADCVDTVEGEYERHGNDMAPNEATYDENKIWQQVNAMRKIVGYKAVKQPTCFEELKALYLFTGVEPPAALRDPSDLLGINEKLRFLMSIIGVK